MLPVSARWDCSRGVDVRILITTARLPGFCVLGACMSLHTRAATACKPFMVSGRSKAWQRAATVLERQQRSVGRQRSTCQYEQSKHSELLPQP